MTAPVSIEGVWQLLRAEQAGESAPALVVERTEIELRRGEYRVRFAGRETDRGTFELGGTPEIRTLVLRGLAGANAGRIIPGIYQLVGDRLRVCYGLDGVVPVNFTTAEGDARYLATYRRIET